jgi:hypothetical protein
MFLDGPLQFLARALQEPPPVAEALVFRIEATVDEIRHGLPQEHEAEKYEAAFGRHHAPTLELRGGFRFQVDST